MHKTLSDSEKYMKKINLNRKGGKGEAGNWAKEGGRT